MSLILIVEDNEKNMKLVRDVLQAKGYATIEAITGEDGIRLAAERKPDLILMDIQLPGMDGLTATGLLKADPVTAAIPVIALTAMAMSMDRSKSLQAGCDGYIAKPLRYQDLYDAIDALLPPSVTASA